MHRIDGAGATGDNKFTEGDPTQAVPATTVTAAWLNAVQEEVAQAITGMGLVLSTGDDTQLWQALRKVYGRSNSGDPNGSLAADVLFERVWDTSVTPAALYVATVADGTVAGTTWTRLVGQASTSQRGLVELATNAETKAGTDTQRAVTPAGLASFDQDLSGDGYKKLPGGLILQWGSTETIISSEETEDIALPITFPTAALTGVSCAISSVSTNPVVVNTRDVTTTHISLHNPSVQGARARWIAIGH